MGILAGQLKCGEDDEGQQGAYEQKDSKALAIAMEHGPKTKRGHHDHRRSDQVCRPHGHD